MRTITVAALKQILSGINHATPIAFTSVTDAGARVTGNPYGIIRKWTRVQAFTGTSYENAVNRQQGREGVADPSAPFQASPRQWGERISAALVSKTDKKTGEIKYYLPAQIQRTTEPLYLIERPHGHGRSMLTVIAKKKVEAFLPAERTTQVAAYQGVEKAVIRRDYSLDSIVQASLNGERLRIRH